jgi:methylmalonyl-CoA mutase
VQQLILKAYTSDGLEYIRTGLSTGMKIDRSTPFFLGYRYEPFYGNKMRAGRMIWAKLVKV